MSTLRPTNDRGRVTLLRTALAGSTRDEANGRSYLAPATRDALEDHAAHLEAATLAVAQAKAEEKQALTAADAAVKALQGQVRHSWQTLRWRQRWEGLPPGVLAYYRLRAGHTPQAPNRAAWLELADHLILGDEAAVAAGFAAAIDPESLPAARQGLETALSQLNRAREQLHSRRAALRADRAACDRLIRHLIGDLRHALREHSPSDQQQIMRTYGVRFRRRSEAPTEDETADARGAVAGWALPQAATAESLSATVAA